MADGVGGDGRRPTFSWRRAVPHLFGIAWVIGAALVTLAPALHRGLWLGPYDILYSSGLTHVSGATVHNTGSGDQIGEMIPWSTMAWTQVHHGHIPLWNPLSGLGMPLAFNWQSAVFSLPAVVSYAFPLHLAYTVQVVATLVIAGSGAYVLARVLHLGAWACATAGTVYELSGAFMGWLGWPHAAVMSWAGWLMAVAILIVRGRHRVRYLVAFAVLVALALLAGEPEIVVILLASVAVVALTLLIARSRLGRAERGWRTPVLDLLVALVAGAGLGAPLLLPGMQVLSRSARNSGSLLTQTEVGRALPGHDLVHLVAAGYNGLPVVGSEVFGDPVYTDTLAYVGVIAVALVVLGVIRHWRRPDVLAVTVLAAVTALVVFLPPVQALFDHVPLVNTIDWHRSLMVLDLCLAVLAGVGMNVVVTAASERSTQRVLASVFSLAVVVCTALMLFATSGLDAADTSIRRHGLIWPLVSSGIGLLLIGALALWSTAHRAGRDRTVGWEGVRTEPADGRTVGDVGPGRLGSPRALIAGRVVGGLLLLLETAFLVVSGAALWSSSSADGAQAPPSVVALQRAVGASTVGFDSFTCFAGPGLSSLGILPEANVLFDVHELDIYDPVLPRGYARSWSEVSRAPDGVPIYNSFCPTVTTAVQARHFGVGYVLVPAGERGPTGTVFDRSVGSEDLYRVPNSGPAVLLPSGNDNGSAADDGTGIPVGVEHPTPSSWRLTTNSPVDRTLLLRLTDLPGWHASIDGHPLPLEPSSGVMLTAEVPAGRHVIEVHYWPELFTVGLLVAALTAVGLVVLVVVAVLRRRQTP